MEYTKADNSVIVATDSSTSNHAFSISRTSHTESSTSNDSMFPDTWHRPHEDVPAHPAARVLNAPPWDAPFVYISTHPQGHVAVERLRQSQICIMWEMPHAHMFCRDSEVRFITMAEVSL